MNKNNPSRYLLLCTVWLGLALGSGGCASLLGNKNAADNDASAEASKKTKLAADQYDDLWERIRAGYGMEALDHPYVTKHEKWFVENPGYLQRVTERAQLYLYYIVEEVEKRGFPSEVALLPAIESAFKPHAYSHARASGLWQFIPSTGKHYGLERNWWYDGRRDVTAATDAAMNYLEKLRNDFDGDWHLALASYNAGEHRVKRELKHNRSRGLPERYEALTRLKPETRNYVPKLLAVANIIADPKKYGIELKPIPNEPYFTQVDIGSQIDLSILAKRADIPIEDLYSINPGFKRWATAPEGPYHLLVPTDKRNDVITALAELPEHQRIQWKRHRIRQGETLSHIARRYGVGVHGIKAANKMRGNRIRAGHDLLIPVSSGSIPRSVARTSQPSKRTVAAAKPAGRVAVVHEVKSGDTLWSIALKYDVYIGQITRWNRVNRRSVLKLGQQLKIWVKPNQAPAAALLTKTAS